jgi:hypothetical protein
VLKKFPWPSWLLFLTIYGVYGWIVGSDNFFLSRFVFAQIKLWGGSSFLLEHKSWVETLIKIIETSFIFLVTLFFSDSLRVMKTIIRKPFSSNVLTFIYILLWSSLIPVVFTWFTYFVRFFIILAGALLLRIDLQRYGYKHFSITWVVCLSGILSFILGLTFFQLWGNHAGTI